MDMKLVRAKELSAIIQSSGKCNLLEKFDEYVIKTRAYNELSHSLNECRIFRNALVHKIFNIEYFFDIVEIADELIKAQEKIIDDLDLYKIEVEK